MPDTGSDIAHVELLAIGDDRLILAYSSPHNDGRRLWVTAIDGGVPREPVLITDNATDIPSDEFRPALASSPGGVIAIAWTSLDMDVFVAMSEDGGASFSDGFRLNLEKRGMQVLPAVAFEGETLRAVWIDPRDAAENAEEPADLYMGTLSGDQYLETNLTENQASSVCGCCRSHIQVEGGQVIVTFRNTTDDGYRDPYQLVLGGEPTAVAPPTWKIEGCPIAGPVTARDRVLWFDGSTGEARILASNGPESEPEVLLESTNDFRVAAAPRLVTGADQMVLVPGSPTSRLIEPDGWRVADLRLPRWATAAAIYGGKLIVVGIDEGSLAYEAHEAP